MTESGTQARLDARYEVKMVAPRESEPEVRLWVRLHPAGFHTAYPRRRVNSIYFDSIHLGSYEENLTGVARRVKLRLRWYGETWVIREGILEMKCKQAGPGWKHHHRMSGELDLGSTTWSEVVRRLRAEAPPRFGRILDGAGRPSVIIAYERDYLVSNDGKIRITIDGHQWAYSQWATERPNITRDSSRHDVIVIETKCSTDDRALLVQTLTNLPLTVSRFSKYVTGVQSSLF